jgi:hypothetical protein
MGIPTEVVGSLPRPTCEATPLMIDYMAVLTPLTDLQQAYADYDAGKIKQDELFRAQDKSVEDSLSNMARTGETLITDGELVKLHYGKAWASTNMTTDQICHISVDRVGSRLSFLLWKLMPPPQHS